MLVVKGGHKKPAPERARKAKGASAPPVVDSPPADAPFFDPDESTHEGRQMRRLELIAMLMAGGLSQSDVNGLRGAASILKDYETAEKSNELPEQMAAMEARLNELEEALNGAKGFAGRASSTLAPPFREGEPAH